MPQKKYFFQHKNKTQTFQYENTFHMYQVQQIIVILILNKQKIRFYLKQSQYVIFQIINPVNFNKKIIVKARTSNTKTLIQKMVSNRLKNSMDPQYSQIIEKSPTKKQYQNTNQNQFRTKMNQQRTKKIWYYKINTFWTFNLNINLLKQQKVSFYYQYISVVQYVSRLQQQTTTVKLQISQGQNNCGEFQNTSTTTITNTVITFQENCRNPNSMQKITTAISSFACVLSLLLMQKRPIRIAY
eukprot:TRINITY_DN5721_c0_g1_i1.p3 TRINITY_DN5721_c0_g1~~TRINITY_DN5721_c0_g1_i1.p3  ORF type:complete len:242 (-),score=-10.53 TRINITY_DN5721_c0_g1_i1:844-1569(-)